MIDTLSASTYNRFNTPTEERRNQEFLPIVMFTPGDNIQHAMFFTGVDQINMNFILDNIADAINAAYPRGKYQAVVLANTKEGGIGLGFKERVKS